MMKTNVTFSLGNKVNAPQKGIRLSLVNKMTLFLKKTKQNRTKTWRHQHPHCRCSTPLIKFSTAYYMLCHMTSLRRQEATVCIAWSLSLHITEPERPFLRILCGIQSSLLFSSHPPSP